MSATPRWIRRVQLERLDAAAIREVLDALPSSAHQKYLVGCLDVALKAPEPEEAGYLRRGELREIVREEIYRCLHRLANQAAPTVAAYPPEQAGVRERRGAAAAEEGWT